MPAELIPFTQTLVALLAGHLVGDFVLQTRAMVTHKRRPAVLLHHVAVVCACTAVAIGQLSPAILAITFVSHLAMDAIKTALLPDKLWTFALDQLVHIGVCAALALAWPQSAGASLWLSWLPPALAPAWHAALALVVLVVAAVPAGGYLIGAVLRPVEAQLDGAPQGLVGGGQLIGCLERALIVLFVLAGQLPLVGFVLAAKSILRFGEVRDSGQRRFAEYVIIGTFLSFGWALLVALTGEPLLRLLLA